MPRILLASLLLTSGALAQDRSSFDIPPTGAPCSTGLSSPTAGSQELFVCTANGDIYRVDDYATSPSGVLLGNPGVGPLGDIAFDPTTGDFVVLDYLEGMVYRVDPVTMVPTLIGDSGVLHLNALEVDDTGHLYARGSDRDLWSIDPVTGDATSIGYTGHRSAGDLAVDVTGGLLGTTDLGMVDEIDPTDGSATVIGPHGIPEGAFGIEVDLDGTVFVLGHAWSVFTYDPATSTSTLVGTIAGAWTSDEMWGCTFRFNPPADDCTTHTYCNPGDGSTNNGATIDISGCDLSGSIVLSMAAGPPNQFAYALIGDGSMVVSQPPGSIGDLCVAGGGCLGRYAKDIGQTTASGTLSLDLSNTASGGPNFGIPVCGGTLQPGDTWNFQFWHRNPMGAPSSFSEAISVTFR